MADIEIVMQPRLSVGELIEACARGELPFGGPDSLYSKVHAMGFKCTSLYESVVAVERAIARQALAERSKAIATGETHDRS